MKERRALPKTAAAVWGDRDAADITRRDAITLLDEIKQTAPVSANRVHGMFNTLWNWAIEDELLGANPLARLKKRAAEQPKDCHAGRRRAAGCMATIDAAGLSPGIVAALKVLVLCGQRPGEAPACAAPKWSTLASWEWPVGGTGRAVKSRKPHWYRSARRRARPHRRRKSVFATRYTEGNQLPRSA